MPNPITNFKNNDGTDLGNILITKEYLMSVYPQIANQLITPELWVWGRNNQAQLGINISGGTTGRCTPVTTFSGGSNWKQIYAGQSTAAIKTDGTLWVWGENIYGQLGINNTTSPICTPVTTFAGGTNWKQVAIHQSTAAIKTDGTLWVWGRNQQSQLGINISGGTTGRCTPVTTFAGGTNWKQVDCGASFKVAVKTDGTLWTWGWNHNSHLGINIAGVSTLRCTPVTTFAGGTDWKSVFCGANISHIAAIKTDGTLWVWGENSSGQLGANHRTTPICTPITTFAGGTNWKQASNMTLSMTAIKTDGTLWSWGANQEGSLGINNVLFIQVCTPITTFAGGTNWKQVSGGNSTVAAIKTDGTLWIWGFNGNGQLGDDTTIAKCTPVTTFAGGTNWKSVVSGYRISYAIKTSDDLQGI